MKSGKDNTHQIIKTASLDDDASGKSSLFSSFPTPCRILCGKGGEGDTDCGVYEKLANLAFKDHLCCCADKAASIIRVHPLKSMAIVAIGGLLIGRCFSRKS